MSLSPSQVRSTTIWARARGYWKRNRKHNRPANFQDCLIGIEQVWTDGFTQQFLTAVGTYHEPTDSFDLHDFYRIVGNVPASSVHWWHPVQSMAKPLGWQELAATTITAREA